MTGTPVLNQDIFTLQPWVQPIAPFPVVRNNMFVAMALMHNHKVDTGVRVRDTEKHILAVHPWEKAGTPETEDTRDAELAAYLAFASPKLGGTNTMFDGTRDLNKLTKLCQAWLDKFPELKPNSSDRFRRNNPCGSGQD
jgi:hypothetical protein